MAFIEGINDQPAELIRFLLKIPVSLTHQIETDLLDRKIEYVSNFFKPQLNASTALYRMWEKVRKASPNEWSDNLEPIEEGTLLAQLDESNFAINHPTLYPFVQKIVLATFTINYAQSYDESYFKDMDFDTLSEDITTTDYLIEAIENIKNDDYDYTEMLVNLYIIESQFTMVQTDLNNLQNPQDIYYEEDDD